MRTLKMSLDTIQGKLSRAEMKEVMAGYMEKANGCPLDCGDVCGSTSGCFCYHSGSPYSYCDTHH